MSDVHYKLKEILVDPDQLVLDPNNPRLSKNAALPQKLDPEALVDPSLQDRIRKSLLRSEHSVSRLIDSISENGFVNIDSIFVKYLEPVDKYLVVEGNRRTTAIKTILSNPTGVKQSSLSTLSVIPVKELICDDDQFAAEMTEFILSIRHIFGVKDWAPMQKAHAVHNAYFERYKKSTGNKKFRYNKDIATQVCRTMNLQPAEVQRALGVYGVYTQMQQTGYSVRSDHYSLIELLVSRPKMAKELFDFETASCRLSDFGMDLFNDLCIEQGCEITNPGKFRKLYSIWKKGSLSDVEAVASGSNTVDQVDAWVDTKAVKRVGEEKLKNAKKMLEQIEVGQLQRTHRERLLADEILSLLREKILPTLSQS